MSTVANHEHTFIYHTRHREGITHAVFFMSRIYGSPFMNVALDLTSAEGSNVGRLLTSLHHPGHKAWPASSRKSRENVDHQESTSNRVSKPLGLERTGVLGREVVWTNVVALCRLP